MLRKCGGNEVSFKRNYEEGSRAYRVKAIENTKGGREVCASKRDNNIGYRNITR